MTPQHSPDLLVGSDTGDDAAVWRLSDDRALVVTADFITPVVDDPRTWGRIAATNAVSDVYAMGGRPLFALNLVAWNREELSLDLLGEVMAGGADVASAGGFFVAGGHSVDDPEPKYGMAVIGEIHPDRILTNAGLRGGQILVLTKPLGLGVITTAVKAGTAPPDVEAEAVAVMTLLNDVACRVALGAGATGATDVTGFGLLGHLGRMLRESGVQAELVVGDVPILGGARELAESGMVPGGSRRNLASVDAQLVRGGVDELDVLLLADAQTSGGLLFGIAADAIDHALAELRASGHTAAAIGTVADGSPGQITLRP